MKTKTITFIEYVNLLHKLGLCEEITTLEQLDRIMESNIIRTYLDTYFSTIPMLRDNQDLTYELKIASNSKEDLRKIANLVDELYSDVNSSKEGSIYVYTLYGDKTPFENIIHNALGYIIRNGIKQNVSMYFTNKETGLDSYVLIDNDSISFKNQINATESFIYADNKFDNIYESFILTIIYSMYHLFNNDLFSSRTEVLVDEDLFDSLKAYIESFKNHYTIEVAQKDYPNIFSEIKDFKNALTINPKLFLYAPKEVLESKEYLKTFLEVVEKYEDRVYDAISFIRMNHKDTTSRDTQIEIISNVYHKNIRFIPSAYEMAIAYQNSLPFLRKKSTHEILISSPFYCKLICLTKNQFDNKSYITELQSKMPFFFTNIYFYHSFYNLKSRKFSNIEQIEKDSNIYLSETIDINLFDFFEKEYHNNDQFNFNLNYALLDTMCQFGIFLEDEFDDDIEHEEEIIKKTKKKYFS